MEWADARLEACGIGEFGRGILGTGEGNFGELRSLIHGGFAAFGRCCSVWLNIVYWSI